MAILGISATVIALNILGLFSREIIPDMSIIIEGGYRILRGQVPYRDFLIPTGPVVFYMQGFFNVLFGVNLWAAAIHAGVLAAILASCFYVLTVEKLGVVASALMAVLTFFSFTGAFNYPWYTSTAAFFFLLNMMLLLGRLESSGFTARDWILSVFLTVLGIYAKQDVGLLHYGLLGVFFVWYPAAGLKKTFWFYVAPVFFISLAIALAYEAAGNFFGSFNWGYGAQATRLRGFFYPDSWHLLFTWRFLGLLLALRLVLQRSLPAAVRAKAFLLAILILVPFITSVTSGTLPWMPLQGVPLIFYVIYDIARDLQPAFVLRQQRWLSFFLIFILLILLRPISIAVEYAGRFLSTLPAMQASPLGQPLKKHFQALALSRIQEGSYKHALMERGEYEDLKMIKALLAANPDDFIAMGEYAFLYADFQREPPVGYPLWFDYGVAVFDRDLPLLEEGLIQKRPALIVFQEPVSPKKDHRLLKRLQAYYLAHGYREVLRAPRKKMLVLKAS